MAIDLGQTIIDNKIQLVSVGMFGLANPGQQFLLIEYVLNGVPGEVKLSGTDFLDFYMNKWNDGSGIFNQTALRNLIPKDVDVQTAELQFVDGLINNTEN